MKLIEALALLNLDCMSDSISPKFVTFANLKVHELEELVSLQLETVGSGLKVNLGLFTDFKIVTLRTNKHGIALDFECDKVCVNSKFLKTIIEEV